MTLEKTIDGNVEWQGSYAGSGFSIGQGLFRIVDPEGGAGPVDVYIHRHELATIIGSQQASEDRLDLTIYLATQHVRYVLGDLAVDDDPDVSVPLETRVVPAPIGVRQATLQTAIRYWRSTDIPLGIAGGMGDLAVRIATKSIPDVDMMLLGHQKTWGLA